MIGLNNTVLVTVTFHGSRSTHELDYPTSKIEKSDLQNKPNIFVRHAITTATTPDYCTCFAIYEIRNSKKDSTLRCVWSNPNKVNPSRENRNLGLVECTD